MKNRMWTYLVGLLSGMMLLSGGYAAASTVLAAAPTGQTFYVSGQRVQFEAYEIHGNNFVKLRDIGKVVDFGVAYDSTANAVHIDPDAHYQEEVTQSAPVPATSAPSAPVVANSPASGSYTITVGHWSREDFSQQANPAVFAGVYDRALYNTIRQTLVDGGPGNAPAYTMVAKGADYSAVTKLLGRMDNTKWLEHYVPKDFTNYWQYLDYFAVSIKTPEQYQAALAYIQPAIAQASQLGSDREKVEYLHDYLCGLMAYDKTATAVAAQIFSPHSGEMKGACGSYARAFNFLCSAANIRSFTVNSADHSWDMGEQGVSSNHQ